VTQHGGEGFLNRLESWGTAIENGSLVVLFGAMMLLAVSQIVMRIFFSFGFVWADELLKLMVLWIALIASIAASRSDRHLRIDVLSHFVPLKYIRIPRATVDLFAALVCGLLAWQSYRYLQLSIEYEETVLVNVPSWIAYGIAPVAFVLMSYRFLLASVVGVVRVFRPKSETSPAPDDAT
jgi:TRAP-type C4-dicarboxylate transport system permease small subunit